MRLLTKEYMGDLLIGLSALVLGFGGWLLRLLSHPEVVSAIFSFCGWLGKALYNEYRFLRRERALRKREAALQAHEHYVGNLHAERPDEGAAR